MGGDGVAVEQDGGLAVGVGAINNWELSIRHWEFGMAEVHSVYCDDCGQEKMAEVRDGKIVIVDRRHGRRHVAVIPLGRGKGE